MIDLTVFPTIDRDIINFIASQLPCEVKALTCADIQVNVVYLPITTKFLQDRHNPDFWNVFLPNESIGIWAGTRVAGLKIINEP